MKNANDNEPLTFTTLGLQAALILNKLRNRQAMIHVVNETQYCAGCVSAEKTSADWVLEVERAEHGGEYAEKNERHGSDPHEQKNEDADRNTDGAGTDKKDSAAHTRYVDQRLRDYRSFEDRADGKRKKV